MSLSARRQCRRGRHDLRHNGRQTLQATLAPARSISRPMSLNLPAARQRARMMETRQLFDLNSLSPADVDMRLSAAQVTVGRIETGAHRARRQPCARRPRGAGHAAKPGLWRIARGSFGSPARMRSPTSRPVPVHRCRPAILRQRLFGISKLSGRGNLNVSLVASGTSPFGLAQSSTAPRR